jgi:capsular exopolysaccharide synthesis family protein
MNDNPLAGYLAPLRRWWWAIVGLMLLAVGVAAVTTPDRGPMSDAEFAASASSFRATHLLIRNSEAPTQLTFELITLLSQQGDLVNRVADRLDGLSAGEVQAIELLPDPTTDTISVTATRRTPQEAVEVANVYADELVAFLDERTLNTVENDFQRVTQRVEEVETSISELQLELESATPGQAEAQLLEADLQSLLQEYSGLRTQQRSLREQRDGATSSFETLEAPSPVPAEDEEVFALPQRPFLRLSFAAVLAAFLGTLSVLVVDRLDTRIRTRREAEDAFGLPVLAELPKRSRRHVQANALPAYSDPGGVTAEVVRALRLSISLAPVWHLTSLVRDESGAVGAKTPVKLGHEPRSIVITSALTGDGKSTLAANLAISIAEGGKRVLVVDCDFRRPAVGQLLEVESGTGLRELTRVDERPLEELAAPSIAPNVAMVRSGSRGVTPAWFMAHAGELVQRCLAIADTVIFDTGPITLTNEASALLPNVDTGLVVVRSGKVARDQARGAVEQLTQVDAHLSGIVLVGSEGRRRYGYGYYRSGAEEPAAEPPVDGADRSRDLWDSAPPAASDGVGSGAVAGQRQSGTPAPPRDPI